MIHSRRFVAPSRKQTWLCLQAYQGDYNPLHTDAVLAESTPFGQRIAHGMLVSSISTGLSQTLGIFEETTIALLQQTFKYRPTFFGDTIHLTLTVSAVKPSSKGGKGVVTFDSEIIKQDGSVVNDGLMGRHVLGQITILFRIRMKA